jgi:hypothetical protein
MNDRFGVNSNVGGSFYQKTKTNWFIGIEGSYIFGKHVDEPGLMQNLLTDANEVIDDEGSIAEIVIQERGFTVGVGCGKLFNIIGPNPNSGILVRANVGFMQHKIRLEHQFNNIAQLEDDYLKGYDRLTNGLYLSEFVGYYHMSNRRIVNFYAGFEVLQAFTRGRRDLNFDTLEVDDQARFDGLLGIRLGWVVHLYSRPPQDFYLN